ncbi:unnamed protein product [Trifolium pratense]|uniref:Uncharacterized protein n=1 Tax=Trifolium pratense TaxID=57577 RepID=A0ACB0JJ54_TRIPR|nr:unnamed protein product [Trifolium pratense]
MLVKRLLGNRIVVLGFDSMIGDREKEEKRRARARAWRRDSRSNRRTFVGSKILQDMCVSLFESLVKLRSDCDTGKGVVYSI